MRHFAEGPALDILDRAVEWAEEYNLEVVGIQPQSS